MELSISGRQRRAAQAGKAAPAAEKKRAGTSGGGAAAKPRRDKAAWSQEALAFLQELNRQDMEKQRKLLEAKKKGRGELDALTKALKTMDKCQKIAARIQRGDKVPPQDERYLMDHDPDGYKLALATREPKKNPKEWETVLEEEDLESGSGDGEAEAADSAGEAAEC